MQDALGVLLLYVDKVVQVRDGLQVILVNLPATLKHFDHDVVVDVGDEVSHFLVRQVEPVEPVLHTFDLDELVVVSDAQTPRLRQLVLHSLELPQEVVDLLEDQHHVVREDG